MNARSRSRNLVGASLSALALSSTWGCSSDSKGHKGTGDDDGGAAEGGKSSRGGASSHGGEASQGGRPGLEVGMGEPDLTVKSALPERPAMTNVRATIVDDNVAIAFDPVDGARDYRVYVLPSDADVSAGADGTVTVKNATYRCAGDRQTPAVTKDGTPQIQSGAVKTLVDGQDIDGYTRHEADASLGFVYTVPGAGRLPVYALGNPSAEGDNDCLFMRWGASRDKRYVTSKDVRDQLVSENWRDDGIVFYVPDSASDKTRPLYTSTGQVQKFGKQARFYFIDGGEADVRKDAETAFDVLTSADANTEELMRVFYENSCGWSHDELAPGPSWFDRARNQGSTDVPVFELSWGGVTAETTLVVEALQDGCPYQGYMATRAADGYQNSFGFDVPSWVTLDDMRAASPTGEVYINGQHDVADAPRPIARSFLKVKPGPAQDLDWFEGFHDSALLDPLGDPPSCTEPNNGACFQTFRKVSDGLDTMFQFAETEHHGFGQMMGELWVNYGDLAADTNGKFRLSPNVKATIAADTYIHTTMTVDCFSTGRRYPQILISDQESPVQWNMKQGNTIILQTRTNWPNTYEVQVCDHVMWDVNQQCPVFDMYHVVDANDSQKLVALAPNAEVGELCTGMDRAVRFDAYTSTERVYLFLDGAPYGCSELPDEGVPSGAVSITFGDVLYHSDVDETFGYSKRHAQVETRRHFDNLGFKSGVIAPPWDFEKHPCTSRLIPQ